LDGDSEKLGVGNLSDMPTAAHQYVQVEDITQRSQKREINVTEKARIIAVLLAN